MKFLVAILLVLSTMNIMSGAEPPIFATSVQNDITASNGTIHLAQYMQVNSDITNASGTALFKLTGDGIVVAKTGLYRLNFFQRAFGNAASNTVTLYLFLDGEANLERYQGLNFGLDEPGELSFTQILRIKAGQTIILSLDICDGSVLLSGAPSSSGFTIEKL